MNFLEGDDLNQDQKLAIKEAGNVFLEACPGSGKTRALTYKIAEQLSKLESKKKFVIAITYTHRAADEIHDRVEKLGVDTSNLWIGTIHSFCLHWILRPYSIYHEKLQNGFRIINSHESEKLITDLCNQIPYKPIGYYDCGYYYTSTGIQLTCRTQNKLRYVDETLKRYNSILNENRQLDFELILKYANDLLRDNAPIRKILSRLFSYILIDEFQDTKEIQYSIVATILKTGNGAVKTFIVGDSNQAIYTSLGGYAITRDQYATLTGLNIKKMSLSKNYRSSQKIIQYFQNFNVTNSSINGVGELKDYESLISYDRQTSKDDLATEIARIIRLNIEVQGIAPNQICVLAPWWIHLASMTRSLVNLLPEYNFTGPGLVPFSRDIDNFWYKLSKITLTDASPENYVRRLRWASEILTLLDEACIGIDHLSNRSVLKFSNSLEIDETDGLKYLMKSFERLFLLMEIDFKAVPTLMEHYYSFFQSSADRIARIQSEGVHFIGDVKTFKKVFANRSGITVSSIHGAKGAEFDTIIAYALLDGAVPHFSEVEQISTAKKLLYVICSRARKNLHLISESLRFNTRRDEYAPTPQLAAYSYNYDDI